MNVTSHAAGGSSGTPGAMLVAHTRAQFLTFLRNVALSAVTVALPVILFTLLAASSPNQPYADGVTIGAYFLASMAAYAVSGVMVFNFGVTVAVDRGERVDLLVRASPLPPALYLLARVITALVFALIALVVLFAFARLAIGVQLPAEMWLRLGASLLVGALPFIGLGFAIAYLTGPNAAVAVTNLTYLVLAFASGIFMPMASLPEFVRNLAPYLPTYHYAQLAWSAVGLHAESLGTSAAWLVGYGALFFVIALFAYQRDETRRFG